MSSTCWLYHRDQYHSSFLYQVTLPYHIYYIFFYLDMLGYTDMLLVPVVIHKNSLVFYAKIDNQSHPHAIHYATNQCIFMSCKICSISSMCHPGIIVNIPFQNIVEAYG